MLNVGKMLELRGQGFSYWKIADLFNSMGVPTKTRKTKWQAATVMKIMKAQRDDKSLCVQKLYFSSFTKFSAFPRLA